MVVCTIRVRAVWVRFPAPRLSNELRERTIQWIVPALKEARSEFDSRRPDNVFDQKSGGLLRLLRRYGLGSIPSSPTLYIDHTFVYFHMTIGTNQDAFIDFNFSLLPRAGQTP